MRSDGVPEMRVRNSREVRGRRVYARWLSSADRIVLLATSRRALTVPLCTEPRTRTPLDPRPFPGTAERERLSGNLSPLTGAFCSTPLHICISTSPHLAHKSPNSVSCFIFHHRMLSVPAHVLYNHLNISSANQFVNVVLDLSLPNVPLHRKGESLTANICVQFGITLVSHVII